MITYNDICTKEDKAHIQRARITLGNHKFNQLISEARTVFREAWDNEQNEIKKPNKARQAVNLLFTKAMNKKL